MSESMLINTQLTEMIKYTLGEKEYNDAESWQLDFLQENIPLGGIQNRRTKYPKQEQGETEADYNDRLSKIRYTIHGCESYPYGKYNVVESKFVDAIISDCDGFLYNNIDPRKTDTWHIREFLISFECKIFFSTSKLLSKTIMFKILVFGDKGIEIVKAIDEGKPFKLSRYQLYSSHGNRDTYRIESVEKSELKEYYSKDYSIIEYKGGW